MRILLVTSRYPPEYTGVGLCMKRIYRYLLRKEPAWALRVMTGSHEVEGKGQDGGVPIYRLRVRRQSQIRWKIVRAFPTLFWAIVEFFLADRHFRKLNPRDFDVVHSCGNSWLALAASWWAHRNRLPLVRELTSMNEHPYNRTWVRPFIRASLRWASLIVPVSPYLAEACNRYGLGDRVQVRSNPVDADRFFPVSDEEKYRERERLFSISIKSDAVLMVSVGHICPWKNQKFLVGVLDRLPDNYHLIMIGPVLLQDQEYLDGILLDAKSRDLLHRLHVLDGHYPDVERYLWASDLLVHASTSEGLATAILEGLMCGLPAVVHLISGVTDAVIQEGVNGALSPLDENRFADAVLRSSELLSEKDNIASLAKSRYETSQIAEDFAALLKRAMAKNTDDSFKIVKPVVGKEA